MKQFKHIDAATVDEAVSSLNRYQGKSRVIAGGTDLLGGLKDAIWPQEPEVIVNLKTISGMQYLRKDADGLKIGALTSLTEIAESSLIRDKYTALHQAALRTASPLLRNLGTVAGNICQENRCWYYRYPKKLGGRIDCVRKGSEQCLAVTGDHRYHSIFGALNKCIAVNPSDTAPALVVLEAKIKTSKRLIAIEEFFSAKNGMKSTILDDDEIITEIQLPQAGARMKSAFKKMALRKTIDFAIVNCAVALTTASAKISSAKICLNAVHNNPYRCLAGEDVLVGKVLDDLNAEAAGAAAVLKAKPLKQNKYKVQMAKTLVRDTVMACN
jgi:xanthine dehydrogenase YagS FAD-binding subunit